MAKLHESPTVINCVGTKPKTIKEFIGMANSGTSHMSMAHMESPEGWEEPGQRPEFEETTLVLKGMLRVELEGSTIDVHAGQCIVTAPGEWVRYSSPLPGGADYVAVCTPAFSPDTVHRDPDPE